MLGPVKKRGPSTASQLNDLQRALDVRFKDRALLQQAVIHRSYLNEHPDEDFALHYVDQ